ncbi:MAG: hypothetical protein ACI9MC_000151 [Kiritimatiellia bacterium]|jgi:hypothetical protein
MQQTYLTLTPEFGGTKFGPFSGTINLGTDGGRCQIVLAASSGIQPLHAMITDTGTAWQVQPVQMGAPVFLRKPNGRVLPVTMAVQAAPGDAVVLGSQSGPALLLSRASVAPVGGAAGGGGSRRGGKLSTDAFSREARRQVESTLITMPYGREAYRFYTRLRSGSFMRPRYIIGAVGGLVFVVGTGCVGCLGTVAAWLGMQ